MNTICRKTFPKGWLLFVLVGWCGLPAAAQQLDSLTRCIRGDKRVHELISKHVLLNQNADGIDGYRIQIFFGSGNNSKNMALNTRATYMEQYRDQEAYIVWQEPNYKVRVGDFRTRLDAQGYLHKIAQDFPGAFIVRDQIQFPKAESDCDDPQ